MRSVGLDFSGWLLRTAVLYAVIWGTITSDVRVWAMTQLPTRTMYLQTSTCNCNCLYHYVDSPQLGYRPLKRKKNNNRARSNSSLPLSRKAAAYKHTCRTCKGNWKRKEIGSPCNMYLKEIFTACDSFLSSPKKYKRGLTGLYPKHQRREKKRINI